MIEFAVVETPEVEPVDLQYARKWLKLLNDLEDDLLTDGLIAGREYVETYLERKLLNTTLDIVLDEWDDFDGIVDLPLGGISEVQEVAYKAEDGTETVWPSDAWSSLSGSPGRFWSLSGEYPEIGAKAGGLRVRVVSGYGSTADKVPTKIRQAITYFAAHQFSTRLPIAFGTPQEIQMTIHDLLRQEKWRHL